MKLEDYEKIEMRIRKLKTEDGNYDKKMSERIDDYKEALDAIEELKDVKDWEIGEEDEFKKEWDRNGYDGYFKLDDIDSWLLRIDD